MSKSLSTMEESQTGRIFKTQRRVRLGDVTPSGRMRLDALARYLQDVGDDDMRDAGLTDAGLWVARRIEMEVTDFPAMGDELVFTTFCTGAGPMWAERCTEVASEKPLLRTTTVWVSLDRTTGSPVAVPDWFTRIYGQASAGRKIHARLTHPAPSRADARPWLIRSTDVDILGHVNNSIAFAVLEDELTRRKLDHPMENVELEYRTPINFGDDVSVLAEQRANLLCVWLMVNGQVSASAQARLAR